MPYKRMRRGKPQWVVDLKTPEGRITKVFRNKDEAMEFEVKTKKLIKAKASISTVCLLEWSEKYLDFCKDRMTDRTFREKHLTFKRFLEGLEPDSPVDIITPELALNKLRKRAEKNTGYAANKDRKNLIAAWNWGQKFLSGWPQVSNPFALVPKFPYSKKARYVPPMEDVEKVMEVMNEDDRTMLLCFLHTGARRNEVFKLKWSDVDFANNEIWLTTRKRKDGMEERDSVPMTQDLREALLRHRGKYGQYEYVFVNGEGKPHVARHRWLKQACKKAEVKAFSYHSIRHLTASWLDAHNVPLTTIQRILRHKSSHTTARYLHELRGVKICLDEVFSRKKEGKVLEFKKKKASNE
ncbi:tyrosine-type recombinase/integrase [Desulfovulcanus sp.]